MCGSVCRSGKAEESNPGGSFPGSCCGAHPAGVGDVHSVGGGNGRIPQGQQNPAAHGNVCWKARTKPLSITRGRESMSALFVAAATL